MKFACRPSHRSAGAVGARDEWRTAVSRPFGYGGRTPAEQVRRGAVPADLEARLGACAHPTPRRHRLAFTALAIRAGDRAADRLCIGAGAGAPIAAPEPRSVVVTQTATDDAALLQGFAAWVLDFGATARAAGISEQTLRAAFSEVRYQPRAVALDRAQPEFTRSVWGSPVTAEVPAM